MQPNPFPNPSFPGDVRRIEAGGTVLSLSERELRLMQRGTTQSVHLEQISKIQSELGQLAVYSGERMALAADVSLFEVEALTFFFAEVRLAVTTLKNRQRLEQGRRDLVQLKSEQLASGSLPLSQLEHYAEDEAAEVRLAVTRHAQVPTWLLVRLARDEGALVRGGVAQHPRTPPDLLRALLEDPDAEVRAQARSNLIAALVRSSMDADPAVRLHAALNQHTPPEALALLGQDPDSEVRDAALDNPSHPDFVERNRLPGELLSAEPADPVSGESALPPPPEQPDFLALELAQSYADSLVQGLRVSFASAPDGLALLATLQLEDDFPRALTLRAFCSGTERVYPREETLELNPGGSAFMVFVPNGEPSAWLLEVQEVNPLRRVRLSPSNVLIFG